MPTIKAQNQKVACLNRKCLAVFCPMENTVLQDYVYNWSRCLFLTSVIHTMQKNKINGHNSCTVPTLWPSFRYFSWSLNSGNLECISYWDIKYFTAKKLKREHHSFAFPYFTHFPFLITFHILSIRSAFNPRRMIILDMGEHEKNQQICGVWHHFCHVVTSKTTVAFTVSTRINMAF